MAQAPSRALDPSEHARLARALEDSTQALELSEVERDAVIRELDAFAYSVSHDLRAPLRAIDGFSQAVLEEYADKLDDTGRDYLRRVRAAAQRMGHLIDDMLKMSRATRHELRRAEVDLAAVATDVVAALRDEDPGRTVSVAIEGDLRVWCDPTLIGSVMENLIRNAWKFTSRRADARIEVGRDSDGAVFVRDNGVGFDPRFADRMFTPFQRLHSTADFDGTGIGLAIVARVIRRHGGKVWAMSVPGQGATFSFTVAPRGGDA